MCEYFQQCSCSCNVKFYTIPNLCIQVHTLLVVDDRLQLVFVWIGTQTHSHTQSEKKETKDTVLIRWRHIHPLQSIRPSFYSFSAICTSTRSVLYDVQLPISFPNIKFVERFAGVATRNRTTM